MGYVEIIKDGVMVQIQDGQVTKVTATETCDQCQKPFDPRTGSKVTDLNKQAVMWFCSKCWNE